MLIYQPCRLLFVAILSFVFLALSPMILWAAEKQLPISVEAQRDASANSGAQPFAVDNAPSSLKRKFINSGILRSQINPYQKQELNFPVFSDAVFIPRFFDSHERFERVDLSNVARLRFLTTTDFYPFNYADENHNLVGYHIDLVRALCTELHMQNICRIEAVPWAELQTRLQAGEADALIAGIAPNKESRTFLNFSRPYLGFPARFIGLYGSEVATNSDIFSRQGHDFSEFLRKYGRDLRVGVIRDTAHQKLLENYFAARVMKLSNSPAKNTQNAWFPSSMFRQKEVWGDMLKQYSNSSKNAVQAYLFPNSAALIRALKEKKIDLAFGDGMRFALLINSQMAEQKTSSAKGQLFVFLGNFYPGPDYLGQGLQIAVAQNNDQLVAAFNYALQQLERKGKLAELYLRYFPVGFY